MEVVLSGAEPSAPSRIQILPTELANQIAAGEVVERPASVVKELVENALDAGARKIEVTLEAGGRRLIRVVDDGGGMSPDEARLALRRHATSKLSAAEDLWTLGTFGFRGEALPSIAAVSRLTLLTKMPDRLAGFRLVVEAGAEIEARETGMSDGTQIEVRDLFFNTPVRLKFLKTEATESGNVSEALLRLALANPGVHIKLRSNDRTVLDLPPVTSAAERVRSALGRRGAGALHEAVGEENGVRVQAFVAAPEEASSTPRNTFLFVGRRAIRDRALLAALTMAYGELLERSRYPLAALFLEIPGAELDVNVHPQKLEVRFARAQEVYAAVRHVVAAAIARAPWLGGSSRPYSLPPSSPPLAADDDVADRVPPAPWSMAGAAARAAAGGSAHFDAGERAGSPARLPFERATPPAFDRAFVRPVTEPPAAFFNDLVYLGQLHRTYLLCEAPGELVIVDQHAAHERLAFQRLRRAYQVRAVAIQRLLFPLEIDVDEPARAAFEDETARATLRELGFEIEAGEGTRLVLRGVPELLKEADPKPLLLDVLHGLGDEPHRSQAEEALDHLFATMACHSVKRAGDSMSAGEVQALLAALDQTDLRSHCPHGRPVLVRLTVSELERRFGRV